MIEKNRYIIAASIVIVAVVVGFFFTTNNKPVENTSTSNTAAVQIVSFSNVAVNDKGNGYFSVIGEATNNDRVAHGTSITATIYGDQGKIISTAQGAILNVAPGATKTFDIGGIGNVAGYQNVKVQIDGIL